MNQARQGNVLKLLNTVYTLKGNENVATGIN